MDFLDKLEQLLLNTSNVSYTVDKNSYPSRKQKIHIQAGITNNNEEKSIYIKEFIHFLKSGEENSKNTYISTSNNNFKFYFSVNFFYVENDNCLMDYILSLNPSEDNLLQLYKKLYLKDSEILLFLDLLREKSSFIQALKIAPACTFLVENDKKFLEQSFEFGKKFQLSLKDYYEIFINYIENSIFIADKDSLVDLFLKYINDDTLLENLLHKLYGEKIIINNAMTLKNTTTIEINNINLMKDYKFINSKELDKILPYFVESVNKNISNLNYIKPIECFKKLDNTSDINCYNLMVDTNNITYIVPLLDLYFKYFVEFNNNADEFTQHLKDNPHIFKNFILYKKLNKKLNSKNIKSEIVKI